MGENTRIYNRFEWWSVEDCACKPFLLGCRPEGANGIIKIGSLSSYDYDNWENFWQYARDLYARLKEEYPQHKLKRKLNFDW